MGANGNANGNESKPIVYVHAVLSRGNQVPGVVLSHLVLHGPTDFHKHGWRGYLILYHYVILVYNKRRTKIICTNIHLR